MNGNVDEVRFSEYGSCHRAVTWLCELSLRDNIRMVISGLRQPPGSGMHRYAVYQLKRLSAPVAGVVVPIAVLLLIHLLARMDAGVPETISAVVRKPVPLPKPEMRQTVGDPEVFLPEPDPGLLRGLQGIDPEFAPAANIAGPALVANAPRLIRVPVTLKDFFGRLDAHRRQKAIGDRGGRPGIGIEDAVIRGLRWLKNCQQQDGSWHLGSGGGPETGAAPAMTGLALLAFLAHGEVPGPECAEFGDTVEMAAKWLVACQRDDGRFRYQDTHEYGHPIAAYALSEAFGMTGTPAVQAAAEKAIDVIIGGQNPSGAWNYNCRPSSRNDTSYTGWCVQALKAAAMVGLPNSGLHTALARAVEGIKSNALLPGGGFGYTGPGSHHLTCVGALCMQLLGAGKGPEALAGLRFLENATCDWDAPWGTSPIYYWYYTTQVKFFAGRRTWNLWNAQFAGELVGNQVVVEGTGNGAGEMGYWEPAHPSEKCTSPVYNTALCTLTLEVYYRTLRTFDLAAVEDGTGSAFGDDDRLDVRITMPDEESS
jgi:hypothetical protein